MKRTNNSRQTWQTEIEGPSGLEKVNAGVGDLAKLILKCAGVTLTEVEDAVQEVCLNVVMSKNLIILI